jgi:Glycosyltransferase like family
MKFTIASAVNNDEILRSCLMASPDIKEAGEVILQRGYASAALAYNAAIASAQNDVIVLIHQDVYLPSGWFQGLESSLKKLSLQDPQWGVLGVYGITSSGKYHGNLYCNANQSILGQPIQEPREVGTLDEIVLILRKSSGLRFDEGLKEFHLYATDICLTARQQSMRSYVVPGFCVHNANEYGMFPRSFWRGYFYLRSKWKACLPIKTPCVEIEHSLWPIVRKNVWRFCWLKAKRKKLARRVDNPAKIYEQIIHTRTPGLNSVKTVAPIEAV